MLSKLDGMLVQEGSEIRTVTAELAEVVARMLASHSGVREGGFTVEIASVSPSEFEGYRFLVSLTLEEYDSMTDAQMECEVEALSEVSQILGLKIREDGGERLDGGSLPRRSWKIQY
jgi:hypothetical protein